MTTADSARLYFDWNATTPPYPEVIVAMGAALADAWGNPSSVHGTGRAARAHVEDAREALGRALGYHVRDVTLTSGGTEANNLALGSAFPASQLPGSLVLSRIEHPSVTQAALALAARGVHVVWVDPLPSGVVPVEAFAEAVARASETAPVRLLSLQAVNHETGVLQPVADVAELAHRVGALLHVDAVQAFGKVDRRAWEGADLVAVAGHKIRGPKGIGALAMRAGLRLVPILRGGAQERGMRPGTQDGAACAGLAVAVRKAEEGPARYATLAVLRDAFERGLDDLGESFGVRPLQNGTAPRVPHVSNLSWPGWRGAELCAALDLEGVAVSSGSACSAGTAEPSPVLTAMVGADRASRAVRISLGDETTQLSVFEAIRVWKRVLTRNGTKAKAKP